jgi:hypothetical protein
MLEMERSVGYSPVKLEATGFQVQAVAGAADVLLIQSALPWQSTADTTVLNQLGYTYAVADMYQVPSLNLNDYQVILIVNDQNQSFYNYIF